MPDQFTIHLKHFGFDLICVFENDYNGKFKNDVPHGQGVMQWPDGKRFEGQFINGKQHGIGMYQDPNYKNG